MRILAVTEYYGRDPWNGSEVFCSQLINALRRRHEIEILARSIEGCETPTGVDHAIPDAVVNDIDALQQLLIEQIGERTYDVIYNLGALIFGCKVVGLLMPMMPYTPLVNHFQALLGPYARIEGLESVLEQANTVGQEEAATQAVANIFSSDSELRAAVEWGFKLGDSFATVIPNGLSAAEFQSVVPDYGFLEPERREKPERPLVVATAGRFSDYSKGADLAYRAFVELYTELPNVFLLSISNSRRFEYLLRELPADSYRVVDWLSRQKFLQILAAADFAVLPSRYEPFGLIAIEAMFLGLPVVANAVGGLQEIVSHGRTGRLNLMRNGSLGLFATMRELVRDRDNLAALGRAARDSVLQRYEIGGVLMQVEKVLARACLSHRDIESLASRPQAHEQQTS